jgi:hypothetical protein
METNVVHEGVKWKPIGIWLAACAGICTLFEKGIFYGSPRDALAYANKNQAKFGEFKGFIIGEVIWGHPQILFEFYREDARSLKRKAKTKAMKHLKKRGIRRWQYQRFLEKNPLERYLQGKKPLRRKSPDSSAPEDEQVME